MLKGRIREISEVSGQERIYLSVWIPRPHNTFTKGETEKDIKDKIQEFKTIHPGEIEFQYIATDDKK